MTSTQDLIKSRIVAAFEDDRCPFLLLDDRQYANAGVLRTVNATTLDHVAEVGYGFQDGYCIFKNKNENVASLWYGRATPGSAKSIPELIDQVVAHLKGEDKP